MLGGVWDGRKTLASISDSRVVPCAEAGLPDHRGSWQPNSCHPHKLQHLQLPRHLTLPLTSGFTLVPCAPPPAPHSGELNFNLLGVLFQGTSIVTESSRLVLIQILLQQRGIKLNPITTLYYIAPACFVFLMFPFAFLELPKMWSTNDWSLNPGLLIVSAASAFGECGCQGPWDHLP